LSIMAVLEYGVPVSHRANEIPQLKEGALGNFKTSVTGKVREGFVGSLSW
jgi:hypothetical protein